MRQRGQAAPLADAPDTFHQLRLFALYRGCRVVRQITIEGFLGSTDVAFAQQDFREVRASRKVFIQSLNLFEGNIDTQRLQLGNQDQVALAAAFLMAANPVAESRGGWTLQEVAEQVDGW